MARKIDETLGRSAVVAWCDRPDGVTRADLLLAVRYTLSELAQDLPGRSVEVRVPPAGAVQVLGGTAHRRGTPPAGVEMSPHTWLSLCTGKVTWADAEEKGLVDASGERADLGAYFPRPTLTCEPQYTPEFY